MTARQLRNPIATVLVVLTIVLCFASGAFADDAFQLMVAKTLAGGGSGVAENVPAQNVAITPAGIATDAIGNVFVGNGNAVLKIDARMRTISTVAGPINGGTSTGYHDGAAGSALFSGITALATDAAGNVCIADGNNHAIRMLNVEANTVCSIVAPSITGTTGCFGTGSPIIATMDKPVAIAVAAAGNMGYVADQSSNIYRLDSAVTRVAGTNSAGYNDGGGKAISAQLNNPLAMVLDPSGNLYIADSGNNLVRKIDTGGNISLVAGSVVSGVPVPGSSGDNGPAVGAALSNPTGLMFQPGDNGNSLQLYIADTGNSAIRTIDPTSGNISTVASGFPIYGLASINNGGVGLNTSHTQVKEVGGFLDLGAAYFGTGAPSPTSTTITAQLTLQQSMTISSIGVPPAYLASRAPGTGFTVGTITGCTIGSPQSSGTTCSIPITFAPQRLLWRGERWQLLDPEKWLEPRR